MYDLEKFSPSWDNMSLNGLESLT